MKYKYIRIVHQGEDYIGVRVDGKYVEVEGYWAMRIIKTLLKKLNK